MKKILLTTAACGVVFAAAPASAADGVKLELGGYFKGYGVFVDQDEAPNAADINEFDILRTTEIHFGGETTLDNGLTVGAHIEMEADGADANNTANGTDIEESYVYFSGGWGRVNFGAEDGAAYLLQVAAPAADSNIDGIRQLIQPVNYATMTQANGIGATNAGAQLNTGSAQGIDYEQNLSGYDDKFTYLSPILNGFQLGFSYAPDAGDAGNSAIRTNNVADANGESYETALRYEGEFNGVGVIAGAGYSLLTLESEGTTAVYDQTDDRQAWNVGLDLNFGPFGLGAIYKEDDRGERVMALPVGTGGPTTADDEQTFVIGADYTTGPFKIGVSYFDQDNTYGIENLDTERYSAGVTYTYGPGMSFNGSIGYIEHDGQNVGGVADLSGNDINDSDATYVSLGTSISF